MVKERKLLHGPALGILGLVQSLAGAGAREKLSLVFSCLFSGKIIPRDSLSKAGPRRRRGPLSL